MQIDRTAIARFFGELRRRKVIRVGIAYAAAAWVVIEVSETILPVLGAPERALPVVIALAAIGFPIALVLAWVFDITPGGVQRTLDLVPAPRPVPIDPFGIAALPIVDRSPGADHQYLADGITDEIINGLARLPGWRVVARTSAFAFRNREGDARAIGGALGVASLIEGGLQVAGDRMRLNVQLIDVERGFASWSETFDRRLDDIFQVQEDIAQRIVTELGKRSGSAMEEGSARIDRSTASVEAYTLYLRGRTHWSERTPVSLNRAADFFRAALEVDPDYAHAHAGLSDCYAVRLDYGVLPPAEALGPAHDHAARALALAPELAEAHGSAAFVAQLQWRWQESEDGFRRALELNPGYAVAHHRLALLLAWHGRFDEARVAIAEGQRTDPLSPAIAATVGFIHYYSRDFDAAAIACRDALQRFPDALIARIALGLVHLARHAPQEALNELQAVVQAAPRSTSNRSLLAHAFARSGRSEEATRLLAELESGPEYFSPYYAALPRVALGQKAEALDRLEAAMGERVPQLAYAAVDPILDPLRNEARFQRILQDVGFHSAP